MKNLYAILLLCAGLLLTGHLAASETEPDLLTPTERAWLAKHPDIALGVGAEWAPVVVKNPNGLFTGFAFEHIDLLNRKLGTSIRLEAGPWHAIVEKAEAGHLSGLTLSGPLEERKTHFLFTLPFQTVQYFIYLRTGQSMPNDGIAGFRGQRVGYSRGVLNLRKLLEAHPGIEAIPMDSTEALAYALLRGEIEAVVDLYALEYWRASHGVLGFTPVHMLTGTQTNLVISVRKDWPELVEVLNKGLAAISQEEMAELYRRWFGQDYLSRIAPQAALTTEEQVWLNEHPVVRVGIDAHWAPVEFMDEADQPQGISVAYLRRLEKLLGVRIEFVPDLTWTEAKQQLNESRLDLLPTMAITPDRQHSIHFTEPYLSFPAAIFSAADVAYLGGLSALEGRIVAVVQDEASQGWLQKDWPQLALLPVANTQEALHKVAEGKAFAFVGNLVTTSYYIGQSGLTQIKVVGETPYTYQLGMGVRQDRPILTGILQKGLDAIPRSERDAIYNDWISIRYQHGVDYGLLWKIMVLATLILLIIGYWNRRLAHEIQQRRLAEASLTEAKQQAEAANRAKSTFLAHMSHELRTPLNAVLGFVQLLERQGSMGDRQRQYIHSIRRGGEQLLDLINDVLELAKIEANRLELRPVAWDSAELVQELTGLFQGRAEYKGLAFHIERSTPVPRMLSCDLKFLRQILVNLLDNAIKFTEQGRIILRLGFTDDTLCLAVVDTGTGIAPAQIEAIFEPFQQAGDAQHQALGVGLGLAISRELAMRMGGTLTVTSTLGQGSTFEVRIPAQVVLPTVPADAKEPSVTVNDASRAGEALEESAFNGQILVVDDEPQNIHFLSDLLREQAYRVHTAESGERALEKAGEIVREGRLDLILLDLLMPGGIDGLETCRHLKASAALRNTPVIFLTAWDDADLIVRAFEAGGADYVLKPFNAEVLLVRVRAHAQLGWLSHHLEAELAQRTAALNLANLQLRQLAMETTLIEEQERKRLAGELHDSPMQKLALAQFQITAGTRHRDQEAEERLETGLELLREALQELRTLQFELSPPLLYQEGLAAALNWLASHATQRFGVALLFTSPPSTLTLDRNLAIMLFQCARELVYNVAKHAKASAGRIELDIQDQAVLLVVSDNGRGFPSATMAVSPGTGGGYGLFSVRERLALLGGSLSIESNAAGTRVSVRTPLAYRFDNAWINDGCHSMMEKTGQEVAIA